MKWVLDIIGKLPTVKGGRCFILLMMDYFTNWVEAKAYFNVMANDVTNFIGKNIIFQFGLPNFLVADNGTQFNNAKVKSFEEMYGIKIKFYQFIILKKME